MAQFIQQSSEALFLILAIMIGAGLATLVGSLYWRRQLRLRETRHRESMSLQQREAEVATREMRTRLESESMAARHQIEADVYQRERKLAEAAEKSRSEAESLAMRIADLSQKASSMERQQEEINQLQRNLDGLQKEYMRRLQELSGLSLESLRTELREEVRRECEDEMRTLKSELLLEGEGQVREEARRILVDCMQRLASTPMHDITATIVALPSEALKGRIIGREGRNIKAFESATGTTLLIDEAPDSVLISSFDPVRREVARLALERLMKDGRIHPASIEEAVAQAGDEVKENVLAAGEDALRRTRLPRMHPEALTHLGKLRFRLSNNQNSLDHAVEVANLCSLIAAEIQLEPEIARRAGLLHDIGKSIEGDYEGSHAVAGANLLKRCGEDPRVINAVAAHHCEVPAESAYAPLVMIADSLSATRPGARSESLDSYIQRVSRLEELAREQKGVREAYAIQAGREIRVIVQPDEVSDEDARFIARNLRTRIEEELQYPGSIRITVIRELRHTEQAK